MKIKIIAIPGNGGSPEIEEDSWFSTIKKHVENENIEVICPNFPDPFLARQEYWLPFIKELGADENTILVGYSSGAIAAMRYAQNNKILGIILVAGYHTDMGMQMEKAAGYFDEPWDWDAIKENTRFIVQFHSSNDPIVPIKEALFVKEKLGSEFYDMQTMGHFQSEFYETAFPELVDIIKKKTNNLS